MASPLAASFREFGDAEAKDSSPLYHHLSHAIAADAGVLEIAAHSKDGQPAPNLLFAAVHYLLERSKREPLHEFYASFSDTVGRPEMAFPAFKDFLLRHREPVVRLLENRLVQTNETARCAYLFPAFSFVASCYPGRKLAMVEIGTSAGLNLLWDRYRYTYDGTSHRGDPSSPVLIPSSFDGAPPPLDAWRMPEISHRIGLDLNVVDSTDEDEAAWLRALIWPEHHDRRDRLQAAIDHRENHDLDLREGDGFSMIQRIVSGLPEGVLPCVYHTHVANQISPERRQEVLATIDSIGGTRDVVHLFNNIHPHLHLTMWRGGTKVDMPLAQVDGHARSIRWLETQPTNP